MVDSGATSTSVCVVIDGKVDMNRCQNINVGGWHVSQFLKQALDWKSQKDNSSLVSCYYYQEKMKKKSLMLYENIFQTISSQKK